jgi:NAD-specific glutamate dehydrogenase
MTAIILNYTTSKKTPFPIRHITHARKHGRQSTQRTRLSRPPVWIQDFGLEHKEKNIEEIKPVFEDVFKRVWRGESENDGFNRLALAAKMTWREITIFRAYWKYLRQTGASFSQRYVEQARVGCVLRTGYKALMNLNSGYKNTPQNGQRQLRKFLPTPSAALREKWRLRHPPSLSTPLAV